MAEQLGGLSPESVRQRHLDAVHGPEYPSSLDQQQRTVEFLQAAVSAGGPQVLKDRYGAEVVLEMAKALSIHPERVEAIVSLPNTIEVRRSLKSQRFPRGQRLRHELVYPTTGWLGAYLDFTILSEQPLAWHFWCGVAALGAACRRNLYVDLGFEDVLFPNHYILLIGDSGLGKNQAINRATRVLQRANQSAHMLKECLARGVDFRVPLMNEVTAESLVDALLPGNVEIGGAGSLVTRTESVGMLVNPEAATLLGRSRKETSDRLFPYLTDLYDGKPRETRTRTRGERNLGPTALSLILGSTVEWISTSISQAIISGGFTGRCSFIARGERDRVKYREIPAGHVPDPAHEAELARLLLPWMMAPPIEVTLDQEAMDWWEEWYIQHRTQPLPSQVLEGWWARKPAHLLKLAMVLVASEHVAHDLDLTKVRSMPLDHRTLVKALDILAVEEERIPAILEKIDRAPEISLQEYVLEKLRGLQEKGEVVTHTRLFFASRWRVGTPTKLREVMDALVDLGAVVRSPGRHWREATYWVPREGDGNGK